MSKGRRQAGNGFLAAGLVLMAAALLLGLYNLWDGWRAGREAQQILSRLEEQIPGNLSADAAAAITENTYSEEMQTVEIDGRSYIGKLAIPALELTLPVMADWDYDSLRSAPCRYAGSCHTDDMVIAGHNYARHFSPLKWIQPGVEVYFTDVEGKVWSYEVDHVETLTASQIQDMTDADDWDLTLFTCTTGGRGRVAVRCIRRNVMDQ